MATYVPKVLIGPAAALTSVVTAYVSPAATNGIARSIMATAKAGSLTLTVAFGADAAGTRLIDAQPLVQNVAFILNGWWMTAQNSAHAIDATSNATGSNCIAQIAGYEYS
jgi:hypothetical protein